ncbi:hypothetical protein ABT247_09665 [Kitasatospora sp. NPDC001539]|uniref:hypothetical protein n=1 Tax=Kitasatospora sp. NPDC001539 TaxID=3154384 RepID=UPI00332C381E
MIDPADINLAEFLVNWFGQPDPVEHIEVDRAWLPDPLREWYGLADRWEQLRATGFRVYDPRQIRVNEGKAEFASDSTGDWFWAFDAADPNAVYETELRGEWDLVPETLSEFLVHLTLAATADSADCSRLCSQVPNDVLPEILSTLDQVDFGGWKWPRPGHLTFMSETLIADIAPAMDFKAPWRTRDGFSTVSVSATTPQALEHLDEISSVKWIARPSLDGS